MYDITDVINSWIQARDDIAARWRGQGSPLYLPNTKSPTINEFARAMDDCTRKLNSCLPTFASPIQQEAFLELSGNLRKLWNLQ